MTISMIGLDTAKAVFQVHGVDESEPTLLLQFVSVLLIALGIALPWLLIQGRNRRKR